MENLLNNTAPRDIGFAKPMSRGFMLALVAVFGAIFLTLSVGLAGYLLQMQKAEANNITDEQAFDIAEAGLNYYAWHLAHFSTDLEDGTSHTGPYVHQYTDPSGANVGNFSLSINGNLECNQPTSVDITSTGTAAANPTRTETIFGRYARESVANYSYIVNTNVHAGASRTILGRYHANGGIYMEGTNLSTVESAVSSWSCTALYGCSPTQTEPGIFGGGSGSALWQYPVAPINFSNIAVNLATLKTAAQTGGGIYLPPLTGTQNQRGYHLVFKSDGTVDVYKVTATVSVPSMTLSDVVQTESNIISSQTFLRNYTIPANCGVIFVEDRAWIEGAVKGKVTVAAADLTNDGYNPDAILPNNITYPADDGTNGLTVVGENNVLIPLNSPSDMTLNGIFIAQNGYYGRNYYCYAGITPGGCITGVSSVPSAYKNDTLPSTLTTNGTIVSNGPTGTSWLSGSVTTSGYQTRVDSYDGTLANNPPPFTPFTSTTYHFVLWRQE